MRHRRCASVTAALVSVVVASSGLVVQSSAASAASAGAPITIALVTSVTGLGASSFAVSQQGFLARIALANAQGGINGHKIIGVVKDDQTSPTSVSTAVQSAISGGALGIVSVSPVFFLAAKYAQKAGIPVTGTVADGPEWGEQPYTNMFASDLGSVDPAYPASTVYAGFLKSHGGTVIGSYGYGVAPLSKGFAIGTAEAFDHLGGKTGVLNTTVPYGSVDFTQDALVAKEQKVDALFPALQESGAIALAEAMKNAGVDIKAAVYSSGYEASTIHSPAWSAVQGAYFVSEERPAQLPDAATRTEVAALQKYEHRSPSNFPDLETDLGWGGADLLLKGISMAGAHPTSAEVISKLRSLTSYNPGGLLARPIDYATIFGHDQPKLCFWYLRAEKNGFVPVSTQPYCGSDIPGTSTASG